MVRAAAENTVCSSNKDKHCVGVKYIAGEAFQALGVCARLQVVGRSGYFSSRYLKPGMQVGITDTHNIFNILQLLLIFFRSQLHHRKNVKSPRYVYMWEGNLQGTNAVLHILLLKSRTALQGLIGHIIASVVGYRSVYCCISGLNLFPPDHITHFFADLTNSQ